MPITQNRMLSLLAAAQDYQQAMVRFFNHLEAVRYKVASGQITAEAALDSIMIQLRPELSLKYPFESPAVLKLEYVHFSRERRRNENKAKKLRENRMAKAFGQPKPQRGNGASSGILGGAKSRPTIGHIEPSSAITSPTSQGYHLDFGLQDLSLQPEPEQPNIEQPNIEQQTTAPQTSPGSTAISPEAKASIEQFLAEAAAQPAQPAPLDEIG